jgi:O-antigen/teichoic acid export membrane protein
VTGTQQEIGRFFRHSGVYALGNMLNRIGAFILLPIYTHYLSVGQYGELELFYVIGAVVSGILSIGIAHTTLRFYFDHAEQSQRNAVVSTNLLASLAISAVGAAALAIWSEDIARRVFHDAAMALGVQITLATLVLELSSQVCLAYLRAREYSVFFIAVSIGKLLVNFSVNAVLLIRYDAGVMGVLMGNFAAVALGWVILTGFTVARCGLRFHWGKLVPMLRYSYPFLLSTLVALVSANVDRVLINALLTLQALGLYALALKFSKLLTDLIGEPFNQAYGAFRFTIMDRADAAEIQARVVRYLAVAGSLAALGLVYFVEALLRVMSAPAYWAAAELVPILALAGAIKVLTYPLQTGILIGKQTRHIFHIGAAVAAVNAAGGLLLISWLGVTGACVALLLSALIDVSLTNFFAQRYFPVKYEYARLLRVLGLAVGFHLLALALAPLGLLTAVAFKSVLYVLFVYALLRLDIFDREELAGARAFVARQWRTVRGAA